MDPATAQRPRRGIGTQCNACGKQFATSYAFDQHRRSGYDAQSTGGHCTTEYVHSHASETQDEAV